MKIPKALGTLFFFAFAFVFIVALLPHVEAQQFYDPTYIGSTPAQGSPRSSLDDQRVLLIGDSHVGGFPGSALGIHITGAGATYYARAGQTGWSINSWHSNRRSMDQLISRHNPTLLVLILGGNDASRVRNADFELLVVDFWNEVQESVYRHALPGTTASICWIGPPTVVGRNRNELQPLRNMVTQTIQRVVGFDHFVRSDDLTNTRFGRTPDGIHFTYGGANDWMRRTIPRLEACVERQRSNNR